MLSIQEFEVHLKPKTPSFLAKPQDPLPLTRHTSYNLVPESSIHMLPHLLTGAFLRPVYSFHHFPSSGGCFSFFPFLFRSPFSSHRPPLLSLRVQLFSKQRSLIVWEEAKSPRYSGLKSCLPSARAKAKVFLFISETSPAVKAKHKGECPEICLPFVFCLFVCFCVVVFS